MQYIIVNRQQLIEAYAKAKVGDELVIVISPDNDFQIYIEEEDMQSTNDWTGCAC